MGQGQTPLPPIDRHTKILREIQTLATLHSAYKNGDFGDGAHLTYFMYGKAMETQDGDAFEEQRDATLQRLQAYNGQLAAQLVSKELRLFRRMYLAGKDNVLGLADADLKHLKLYTPKMREQYNYFFDYLQQSIAIYKENDEPVPEETLRQLSDSLHGKLGTDSTVKDTVCDDILDSYHNITEVLLEMLRHGYAYALVRLTNDKDDGLDHWNKSGPKLDILLNHCHEYLLEGQALVEELRKIPASVFECDETALDPVHVPSRPLREHEAAVKADLKNVRADFEKVAANDPQTMQRLAPGFTAEPSLEKLNRQYVEKGYALMLKDMAIAVSGVSLSSRLEKLISREYKDVFGSMPEGGSDADAVQQVYRALGTNIHECRTTFAKHARKNVRHMSVIEEEEQNLITTLNIAFAADTSKDRKSTSDIIPSVSDALSSAFLQYADLRIQGAQMGLAYVSAAGEQMSGLTRVNFLEHLRKTYLDTAQDSYDRGCAFAPGIPAMRRKIRTEKGLNKQLN